MNFFTTVKTSMLSIIALGNAMTISAATIIDNGITYSSSGTDLTVAASSSDAYSGDIVIESPINIDGIEYTVVGISSSAFKSNADITSIYLPDDCITIPRGSFQDCSSLKSIRLSPNMTTWNGNLFQSCTSLEEITIPGGVKAATSSQLKGCSSLKKITIAEGDTELDINVTLMGVDNDNGYYMPPIEEIILNRQISSTYSTPSVIPFRGITTLKNLTIGGSTTSVIECYFEDCSALESVEIANTVTELGASTFAGTGLIEIELPNSLTSVPSSCFQNCSNLTTVTLNEGITSIGDMAFSGTALSNITLPSTLKTISTLAFNDCNLQGDITLPASVSTIGDQAFAGNSNITSFSLPASLTSLGDGAFKGCSSIGSFSVDAANTSYKVKDNQTLSTIDGLTIVAYPSAYSATTFTDNEATSIGSYAFYNATNLTEINLGSCSKYGDYSLSGTMIPNITLNGTIGRYVLQGCPLLKEITLTNSHEIPFGVVSECAALEEFTSTTDILTIKQEAFDGCVALKDLDLGGLLCIIEADAFKDCGVENITLSAAIPAAMADGVFTEANSNITVTVPIDYVDDYKAANGWKYLNIVGDANLAATGTSMGMPNGLYYAGKDGMIYCIDNNGDTQSYDVGGVPHTFQLAQFKNRIYGASAGEKFVYSDTGDIDGDGKLFYVSQLDGNTFQAVVLDNTDGNAYKDPFGLYIYGDTLYVNDRNVAIRKISADAIALPQDYESWVENSWLGYYGSPWTYGCIKAGFSITQDEDANGNPEPLYWLGIKFNGNGIFRFKEKDINSGSRPDYTAIMNNINPIFTTFYIDENNNHLYIYLESATGGVTGALYRINMSDILANPNPSDFYSLNPIVIDDSPVLYEGSGTNEHVGIPQLSPDENAEYLYWCYNAPTSEDDSYHGAGPLDENNPLHHSGIKRIKLGEDEPVVEMVVAGVTGYGIVPVSFDSSSVKSIEADVTANRLQVIGNAVTVLEKAIVNIYAVNGMLVEKVATNVTQSISLNDNVTGIYVVEAIFADGSHEIVKVAVK